MVVEPESGGDNERDDHGTCVKREDVLNTQNGEFPKGRNLIDGMGADEGLDAICVSWTFIQVVLGTPLFSVISMIVLRVI